MNPVILDEGAVAFAPDAILNATDVIVANDDTPGQKRDTAVSCAAEHGGYSTTAPLAPLSIKMFDAS